ncbi:hypothetical protein HPP92_010474 [Vanilla planifolia]|uniref:Uncharacterized protein n=1 Tax=Vanilla planifolia TaxID=51239 RepID=A0A835QTZ4_VANPL|nr:hypothetical protein HPP92_010474 [Vanilla planifolia]
MKDTTCNAVHNLSLSYTYMIKVDKTYNKSLSFNANLLALRVGNKRKQGVGELEEVVTFF